MSKIPSVISEITAEWLTSVLTENGMLKGETVTSVVSMPLGEDLGYLSFLYRLRMTYSNADSQHPATMIAKFPSDEPGSRSTGNGLRAFEREMLFYKNCGADSPSQPPAHYYSHCDVAGDEYLLLMEDLEGCRFVNQVDGVSPDDARLCMRTLAAHHAQYWQKVDKLDWVPDFSEYGELYKPLLETGTPLIMQNWQMDPVLGEHIERANAAYPLITSTLSALPQTLIHCDPRIENVAFAGGQPRFYDWQLVSKGPAAYDVMYFLKQSMDRDIRQSCQDVLFSDYLEVLNDNGIDYSQESLLEDLGLATCTIWGFVGMIGNFFFPSEINEAIYDVTMPRFIGMIEDFGGVKQLDKLSA